MAGDLIAPPSLGIIWLQEHFKKPVIYLSGNHEYYGFNLIFENHMAVGSPFENVHYLHRKAVTIDDVTFIGCTLWTDYQLYGDQTDAMYYASRCMNDHNYIYYDDNKVFTSENALEEHLKDKKFLINELKKKRNKVVVVTHHAPSEQSVAEWYKGDRLTPAFASNLENTILTYQPNLWVHGHCVDDKTEILTVNGWKKYNEIYQNEKLYSINPETLEIEYDDIHEIIILENYNENVIEFNRNGIDMCVTEEHAIPYLNTTKSKYHVKRAIDYFNLNNSFLIRSGILKNKGLNWKDRLLELYISIVSDGNITPANLIRS
jgi:predicted phosphohydrolase